MQGMSHWVLPSKKKKTSNTVYNGMLFDFKVDKESESTENQKSTTTNLSKMNISYILN